MAQTKRKRRTKHRGNAAGQVEVRGRTGRKPTETKGKASKPRQTARERREERFNKPPTWSGAATRAAIATALFVVVMLVTNLATTRSAIALSVPLLLMYIPMGYYTDLYMYRRRQRKKAG